MRASFSIQNEYNLVSIGDSQTNDRIGGASLLQTYPALMRTTRGWGWFTNAGVDGNTTTAMETRFATDVLAHRPGSISIMGGPNDWTTNISAGNWVGSGTTSAQTKAKLKAMVEAGQAARAHVTLLSPVPVFQAVYTNNVSDWMTKMAEIASETGCAYIDIYAAWTALDSGVRNSYLVDDQHPNALGHAYIASLCSAPAFSQA